MKTKDDGFNPRLAELVEPYIKTRAKDKIIDPAVVAEMVMRDLDKVRIVKNDYPQIYFAAHHAVRQTAREILRRRYPRGGSAMSEGAGHREREAPIPGLETDRLQRRYPQAHKSLDVDDEDDDDAGRGYILREAMSEEDWLWNLGQFDKDIVARQKHRDQLKQWGVKTKGWSDPDEVGFGT